MPKVDKIFFRDQVQKFTEAGDEEVVAGFCEDASLRNPFKSGTWEYEPAGSVFTPAVYEEMTIKLVTGVEKTVTDYTKLLTQQQRTPKNYNYDVRYINCNDRKDRKDQIDYMFKL